MNKKIRITQEDWNNRTERKRREGEGSINALNMAVLEYLVADGMKDAAIAFREEAGLTDRVLDLDSIERRSKVLESIRRGETPEVLEMLTREMSNDEALRFELHNHTLIELYVEVSPCAPWNMRERTCVGSSVTRRRRRKSTIHRRTKSEEQGSNVQWVF